MAVRVQCPHCRSMCLVDENHVGTPVQCGRCAQPFSVRLPAAPAAVGSRSGVGLQRPTPPPSLHSSTDDDEINLEWDAPGAAEFMGQKSTPAASRAQSAPATAPTAAALKLDVGGITHPGRARSRNEDSFLIQSLSWSNLDQRRDMALIVVADGVGGYEAGDQASGLAIRVVGNTVAPLLTGVLTGQHPNVTPQQLAQTIDSSIHAANRVVFQRAQSSPACKGMASTAVVLLIWDGQVYIGHVGDTRVYHYRAGYLSQLTRDQTLLQKMIDLGQLSPREAQNHPAKNEVAQAVGKHAEVAAASYQVRLNAGDWLIAACDGLHAHVDAKMLENALRNAPPSAGLVAQQLVDLSNQHGGSDNVTVVAVRCS